MKNLPELHCEDKNSHLSTLSLMEYLNNYQARRTIWDWYQEPTRISLEITKQTKQNKKSNNKKKKKKQASSNSKYLTTKYFCLFSFSYFA